MKRLIGVITAFTFILSMQAFAEETKTVKLGDAINSAISNCKQLEIDAMKISASKKEYELSQKDASFVFISDSETPKEYLSKQGSEYLSSKRKEKDLIPEQKKYEVLKNEKTKEFNITNLKKDVCDTYYSLVKINNTIDTTNKVIKFENKKLVQMLKKCNQGLISKNEYTLLKLSKKNIDSQLKLLKNEQSRLVLKLNRLTGQEYNLKEVKLDNNLSYELIQVNVENEINKALNNRLEIFKLTEELKLKQLEFDIIDRYYTNDTVEYKDALNDLEEAKLKLNDAKLDIEQEIRTSYNDLLSLYDQIEINKQNVEIDTIKYNVTVLKNKLGLADNIEVEEAKTNLDKSQTELDNSIVDYLAEKYKFEL